MEKGFVQVYTGNGKGKTTCMLGLALRAVGAGKRVYIGQFLKLEEYSEIVAMHTFLPMIDVEQYGSGQWAKAGDQAQSTCAQSGLDRARRALTGAQYDLVLLDEINVAMHMGLLQTEQVLELMREKPEKVELVLTGRYAPQQVMDAADLVTEMREIRHYYSKGIMARTGIEK